MRQCPHCSELIQDAADFCRFCRSDVTPTMACSEKWKQFGTKFHRLSAGKQQTMWDQLGPDDRVSAQKLLGIVPPQLPGIREAINDMTAERKSHKSGSFFAFFMVISFCLMVVVGAYLLLPLIEGPGVKSGDGDSRPLSTSERIDQAIDKAYETVAMLAADLGGAGTDTVSSVAGDIAADTPDPSAPPVPPNP